MSKVYIAKEFTLAELFIEMIMMKLRKPKRLETPEDLKHKYDASHFRVGPMEMLR